MSTNVAVRGLKGVLGLGLVSLVACGGSVLDASEKGIAGDGGRADSGGASGDSSSEPPAGGRALGSGGRNAGGPLGRAGAAPAIGGRGNVEAGVGGVAEVAGSPDEVAGAGPIDTGDGMEAVAFQINPAHSGWQPLGSVRLPLSQRWQRSFEGNLSYPVVAGGRVFVTTRNILSSGTNLYALNAETGEQSWKPVALGGTYFWSAVAYEAGRVFALNHDGRLSAFEAASGKQDWSIQLPDQYSFSSAPTAFGGRVYAGGAGSGGTVYAVDETNGNVLWSAAVENGDDSSPAVSPTGVYVSYACNQAYGFNPATGLALWHYSGQCEGGGGKTVMLDNGTVYTRDFDGNLLLDAVLGTSQGTYASQTIPAAANGNLYTLNDGVLSATAIGQTVPSWTFGDGTLVTAPIVVGQSVIVGSSAGALNVLSAKDGSVLGQAQVGTGLRGPDEQNVSQPLTGLAAAEGKLFVPSGADLFAY